MEKGERSRISFSSLLLPTRVYRLRGVKSASWAHRKSGSLLSILHFSFSCSRSSAWRSIHTVSVRQNGGKLLRTDT